MHLQRNYYEVLGLPRGATTVEIKQKYRELARKFHPDLVEDKVLGQRIFTQINQAYRTLSDSERRSEYDASLRGAAAARAGGAPTIVSATYASRQNGTANGNGSANGNANGARPKPNLDNQIREADDAMMQGQASKARSLCDAILKIDPENAKTLGILGDALAHLKKNDEAAQAYRKSLSIMQTSIVQSKLSRLESLMQAERVSEIAELAKAAASSKSHKNDTSGSNIFSRLLKRK
jgi:curved DNA-binding protein CbpA